MFVKLKVSRMLARQVFKPRYHHNDKSYELFFSDKAVAPWKPYEFYTESNKVYRLIFGCPDH